MRTFLALLVVVVVGCGSSNGAGVAKDGGRVLDAKAGADGSMVARDSGPRGDSAARSDGSARSDSGATADSGPSGDGGSSDNFYIYQNHSGTGTLGQNVPWDSNYDFGTGAIIGNDTTHPMPGHTYDLYNPGTVGWQPFSDLISGYPDGSGSYDMPIGFDLQPYTWMTVDLWTATPTDQFDSLWHYLGDNAIGQSDAFNASAYLLNLSTVGTITAGTWSRVTFPLIHVGQLGTIGCYKFYLRDNTDSHPSYWDNVGFIPGGYSMIYTGGAPNGYDNTTVDPAGSLVSGVRYKITTPGSTVWTAVGAANNNTGTHFVATGAGSGTGSATRDTWKHDPVALLNGWSDASVSCNANYSWDPATSSGTYFKNSNAVSANGPVNPGYSPIASTKAIELSITASGGMWKITHAGFDVTRYTHLALALIPTNTMHSYEVQLYGAGGAPVGTAVNPSMYTPQDWGNGGAYGGNWTTYAIPLTAFGSLPSTIGGLSIKDTSGLSTNVIYLSSPAFFY